MNNPVAPVVTDEMVEAGLHKGFEGEGEEIAVLKADRTFWEIYQRDMRAAITAALEASDELERLRAALDDIFEMWAGSEGFIPHTAPEGYLLMLVKKMADRAALAKMEESK